MHSILHRVLVVQTRTRGYGDHLSLTSALSLGVFHAVNEDFTKAAVFQKARVSGGSLVQEFPRIIHHTARRSALA